MLVYIIITIAVVVSVLLSKNLKLTKSLIALFLVSQSLYIIYSYVNLGKEELLFFKYDALGVLFNIVLNIISISSFYYAHYYFERKQATIKERNFFNVLMLLLLFVLLLAAFSKNMAILWVLIEITTLLAAGLLYFERSEVAIEASWKYLFMGSLGVAFAFVGILIISVVDSTSGVVALNFEELYTNSMLLNSLWVKISFLFILTGLSVKLSLVPLFPASIDAKTVAPSPVNAILSTLLINVAFIAIYRFYSALSNSSSFNWINNLILLTAILSLFIATVQLFKVKRVSRLFAFSSMEHISIVLLGVYAGGFAVYAAILHLVLHSFAKSGLFYQIHGLMKYYGSYWFRDISNYFKISQINSLSLLVGMVIILALPPSALFVTEFYILKELFINEQYLVLAIVLFLLTVIIFKFGKSVLKLVFSVEEKEVTIGEQKNDFIEMLPVLVLFAICIMFSFYIPDFVNSLIYSSLELLLNAAN